MFHLKQRFALAPHHREKTIQDFKVETARLLQKSLIKDHPKKTYEEFFSALLWTTVVCSIFSEMHSSLSVIMRLFPVEYFILNCVLLTFVTFSKCFISGKWVLKQLDKFHIYIQMIIVVISFTVIAILAIGLMVFYGYLLKIFIDEAINYQLITLFFTLITNR
ncbi:unnamed protein product [Commensalibacter communis]|uniref:hypothetical protein n=1 Tax=Commensalibacter communis TaxID=2972786 RepID=UPI0022FF8646|nr:hypothetical protein [Commensalibacter communis]CAI3939591.1 unnamed protein product [Commensalibacter communis]